jgi:hypothetical protein
MIKAIAVFERDLPAGFDGVFMWDFLAGAFGPVIMPMDFDAVVERKGSFLVFETKAPGTEMPKGQRLTLEQLLHDKRFTVIYCAKRAEDIQQWEVWTRSGRTVIRGDAAALWAWCNAWFEDKNDRDPVW